MFLRDKRQSSCPSHRCPLLVDNGWGPGRSAAIVLGRIPLGSSKRPWPGHWCVQVGMYSHYGFEILCHNRCPVALQPSMRILGCLFDKHRQLLLAGYSGTPFPGSPLVLAAKKAAPHPLLACICRACLRAAWTDVHLVSLGSYN